MRRERSLRERAHIVINTACDVVCVGHDHLVSLLLSEIGKLVQHLARCAVIQPAVAVIIPEFHAGLQNLAVYLILRIHEVRVAGGNHRLAVLLAQCDHAPVQIAQSLIILDSALRDQEPVVADRLNFQIIIEPDDRLNLCLRLVV